MCEYIDMLEAKGEARGIEKGKAIGVKKGVRKGVRKGETRLARLIQRLLLEEKFDDIALASSSSQKRHELYRLYGI